MSSGTPGQVVGIRSPRISWVSVGNVGKLLPALPNLRSLHLRGGDIGLGTLELPKLERAESVVLDQLAHDEANAAGQVQDDAETADAPPAPVSPACPSR